MPTLVETAGRARRRAATPARPEGEPQTDLPPRAGWRRPGALVAALEPLLLPVGAPAAAVALAALSVAACAATSSLWPAVLLPVVGTALGGARLPRPSAATAAAALLGGLLAAVVLASRDGLDPVAAASLLGAAALCAATAVAWGVQRRESARDLAATRAVVRDVGVLDPATGCVNPHGLDLIARHVLGLVQRHSWAMHASMVRVGDLDVVEELGGREAVDRVVGLVADALRASTRGADVVSRWSQDVFLVVGPGTGTAPVELERRLRARVLGESALPASRWACPVTVGSALLEPWDAGGLELLLDRAEEDLGLRRALREPSAPEAPRPQDRAR